MLFSPIPKTDRSQFCFLAAINYWIMFPFQTYLFLLACLLINNDVVLPSRYNPTHDQLAHEKLSQTKREETPKRISRNEEICFFVVVSFLFCPLNERENSLKCHPSPSPSLSSGGRGGQSFSPLRPYRVRGRRQFTFQTTRKKHPQH